MDCEPIGPVEPRRLDQVLSLRLAPETAAALRDIANQRGVAVSDLLREQAERIARWGGPDEPAARFEATATWRCEHLTMTGPFPVAPTGYCGCELQPA